LARFDIAVFRFDPAAGSKESYDAYALDFEHQPTVLEVLRKIRDEQDASLAFRESCGLGKCGSCAVMVGGQPVLACRFVLPPGPVRIDPLANHPVVKDLVVDRAEFDDRLVRMRTFHPRPDDDRPEEKPLQWSHAYRELTRCIGCLVCESTCPSFAKDPAAFPGPALLVQLARPLAHPLAKGDEAHVAWMDGVHNCTACMNCTRVCPQKIDPFRNAVLPLRSAVSGRSLALPHMQEGICEQFHKSGRVVPATRQAVGVGHDAMDPGSDTAVFLGCMLGHRYPQEGRIVLDLLSALDVRVQVPEGLVCCGGPLGWVGKKEEAEAAFEKNTRVLIGSGVRRVITPCTGCRLTLSADYADLYRQQTGDSLPFEVADVADLLSDRIDRLEADNTRGIRALFHLPCHRGEGQLRLAESFEKRKYPGVQPVGRTDRCCGGMTASSNPALAFGLSAEVLGEAAAAGAEMLLTACIFCRDNLHRAARRLRSPIKVEHILVFLARHLGSAKGETGDD